jgi:hypothetical protein
MLLLTLGELLVHQNRDLDFELKLDNFGRGVRIRFSANLKTV